MVEHSLAGGHYAEPIGLALVLPQAAVEKAITMHMDNIPLGEVIRYWCMGAGFRFRIERQSVIIASGDALSEMATRYLLVARFAAEDLREAVLRGMRRPAAPSRPH